MKRSAWLIVGGILLVALLGGAAYVGGKLLGRNPSGALGALFSPHGNEGHRHAIALGQLKPAPELPQTPADVMGILNHTADRSLFVKSSSGPVSVWSDESGQTANGADGPIVEVVVNQDTKIYRDTTELPSYLAPDEMVQQTVAEGSLDEIGQNVMVKVWGKRSGDRIVATTLEYNQ